MYFILPIFIVSIVVHLLGICQVVCKLFTSRRDNEKFHSILVKQIVYLSYIIVFTVPIEITLLYWTPKIYLSIHHHLPNYNKIKQHSQRLFNARGILLPVVRILEPLVMKEVERKLKAVILWLQGKKMKRNIKIEAESFKMMQTNNVFLASKQNNLFVKGVINGIWRSLIENQ